MDPLWFNPLADIGGMTMAPYIPDNGNETPFVVTTQFPEHLPRLSQQPTLVSGCHGLPAEVTIGCGGGTYSGPRMAGNGETYTPVPGRVAGPGDSPTLRRGHSIYASADCRPTFHEWVKDCRENLGSAHPISFTQPGT